MTSVDMPFMVFVGAVALVLVALAYRIWADRRWINESTMVAANLGLVPLSDAEGEALLDRMDASGGLHLLTLGRDWRIKNATSDQNIPKRFLFEFSYTHVFSRLISPK